MSLDWLVPLANMTILNKSPFSAFYYLLASFNYGGSVANPGSLALLGNRLCLSNVTIGDVSRIFIAVCTGTLLKTSVFYIFILTRRLFKNQCFKPLYIKAFILKLHFYIKAFIFISG